MMCLLLLLLMMKMVMLLLLLLLLVQRHDTAAGAQARCWCGASATPGRTGEQGRDRCRTEDRPSMPVRWLDLVWTGDCTTRTTDRHP